ncbi:MAG: nitrate ABC transporter ATP-binding protein [Gammaproteobacteria bacterium]|nr:nitrate ABC transporter ATP-binding protein [Gammaproteobacteria bacterium]
MNSYLDIDHIGITFPSDQGPIRVLEDFDLRVAEGEFVSLIGHSGCGKSTVLNIVAGLLKATEGGVLLQNREVDEPGPDRAVVFQHHALMPWLTVYGNVRLAVDRVFRRTKTRAERHLWTLQNLELVHMDHALDRKPGEISGGMKQRVGIARALAMEPKVLLMDEPFGARDSLTRSHMQDSLIEIQGRLQNTIIMITHDVDEAVLLSDRIVMMTNGPAATIGEILEVDLPKPRSRLALAENPVYNHYRAEVVRFLHRNHQAPARSGDGASVVDLSAWIRSTQAAGVRRLERPELRLGFVPLTDCAPLVVAKEKGFFLEQGLNVELSRENSWANIRDKVAVGLLDGAQMLAAMPLASNLGLAGSTPTVAAMSLDLNGNGITVSSSLYKRMAATGEPALDTPLGSGRALRRVIDARREAGEGPLTFAMVFPYSSHNYLLRYWLAAAGIDPDRDLEIIVVPPPQMVSHLEAGLISGFSVGEPWNTMAVCNGLGRILATSHDIWNNHPEKVFGVSSAWAAANPNTLRAVVTALARACAWIDETENRPEVCQLLAKGRYVNAPREVLENSLLGTFRFAHDEAPVARPDFNVFSRHAATFPWRSHAVWFLTQMVRWGQVDRPVDLHRVAAMAYRPEFYRLAAQDGDMLVPEADVKDEGVHDGPWAMEVPGGVLDMGPDRFFDGMSFHPGDPVGYLEAMPIRHLAMGMAELAALNPPRDFAARAMEAQTRVKGGARQ